MARWLALDIMKERKQQAGHVTVTRTERCCYTAKDDRCTILIVSMTDKATIIMEEDVMTKNMIIGWFASNVRCQLLLCNHRIGVGVLTTCYGLGYVD